MSEQKKTKKAFEAKLNNFEVPDIKNFGSWLRRHDPIRFEVEYQLWRRQR